MTGHRRLRPATHLQCQQLTTALKKAKPPGVPRYRQVPHLYMR